MRCIPTAACSARTWPTSSAACNRICAFYGVRPAIIFCSATIANPGELAESAARRARSTAITESGAPRGRKASAVLESARDQSGPRPARLRPLPDHPHRPQRHQSRLRPSCSPIRRLMVEVLTKYLKDVFDSDPAPAAAQSLLIAAAICLRNGARPQRGCGRGELDCVVATNALELGVDIGGARCLPAQWLSRHHRRNLAAAGPRRAAQSAGDGRADRDQRSARSIHRAQSGILHGRVARARLHRSRPVADPDGPCPLRRVRAAVRRRANASAASPWPRCSATSSSRACCITKGDRWHWIADSYPANSVSLRSVADGNFVVVDVTGGKQDVIAEVDYSSAALTLYEGAIYLIQASPWQVEKLDWEGRKAFVTRTHADYYTDAIDFTKLKILDCFEEEKGQAVQTEREARAATAKCIWCAASQATRRYATTATKTSATAR